MSLSSRPGWRKQWSIGIFWGPSPLNLTPAALPQPVFTGQSMSGAPASSVADPFLLFHGNVWHLFFEVWNSKAGRGEIGCATSVDALAWTPGRVVLRESFHLSYPCVFECGGEIYMVPESRQVQSIRLYRAEQFPLRWSFVRTLVEGCYADPTVFWHEGYWWMFAQRGLDELRLFMSAHPDGEWSEHPANPVRAGNRRITRPAGRVVRFGDRLLRFAQDGLPTYGTCVRALEIRALTPTQYEDCELTESPILQPAGDGWNAVGMHHADCHCLPGGSWIAAVDGATLALY